MSKRNLEYAVFGSNKSRKTVFFSTSGLASAHIIAGLIYFSTPTISAISDISSYISGLNNNNGQVARLIASPAGSVHSATLLLDKQTTGTIPVQAGFQLPNGEKISIAVEDTVLEVTSDEERVTSHLKKGRIVAVSPSAPPKNFSAGSVLQRQSFNLLRSNNQIGVKMAFVKNANSGLGIKIAGIFHKKKPALIDRQVPSMLASLVTNERADILATAYAPQRPDYAKKSPFSSILTNPPTKSGRFLPPIGKDDHAWAAQALPARSFTKNEQRCLTAGVYFEARGEPVKGQAAVAQVILNRVRNPTYPKTICGVVYQNKNWRNRCQFSFACDGIRDSVHSPKFWATAKEVAMAVTAGKVWLKAVGSSTHYHATYVKPRWARSMKRVGRIGLHIFYRTYGSGWS